MYDRPVYRLMATIKLDEDDYPVITKPCFSGAGSNDKYSFGLCSYLQRGLLIEYFTELQKVWSFSYSFLSLTPEEQHKLFLHLYPGYRHKTQKHLEDIVIVKLDAPNKWYDLVLAGNFMKAVSEWPEVIWRIHKDKGKLDIHTLMQDIKVVYKQLTAEYVDRYNKAPKETRTTSAMDPRDFYSDHFPWYTINNFLPLHTTVASIKEAADNHMVASSEIWGSAVRYKQKEVA